MSPRKKKPPESVPRAFWTCPETGLDLETPLRVGQSGIDTTGERADVVAEHAVGAVDHDRDGRQDERVFRHRLATRVANDRLTSADEHLRHCFHFHISFFTALMGTVEAIRFVLFCLEMRIK